MASIVKTVMTGGGGDFTSLSAALTALAQDLTLITPTINDIDGATTIAMDIVCSGAAADTTATNTTISGWTSNPTHKLRIRGAATGAPKWDTTKWRLSNANATNGSLLVNQAIDLDLLDLQIENTATLDLAPHWLRLNEFAWNVRIDRCFGRCTGTTGTPSGVVPLLVNSFSSAHTLMMRNFVSVAAGAVTQNINTGGSATCTQVFYNGTVVNFSTGAVFAFQRTAGSTTRFKNLLLQGAGTTNYQNIGSGSPTTTATILTQDTTSPTTALRSKTVAFVNAAAYDFHQLGTDPSVAVGSNLSADANWAFSDDASGATRGATWDVGADQFVASAAADTRPDLMHDPGFQVQLATM